MYGRTRISVGLRCHRERDSWWRRRRSSLAGKRKGATLTQGHSWFSPCRRRFFYKQFGVCTTVEGERRSLEERNAGERFTGSDVYTRRQHCAPDCVKLSSVSDTKVLARDARAPTREEFEAAVEFQV